MKSYLDVVCDVKLWTELSDADQLVLELKAYNNPVFFWNHPSRSLPWNNISASIKSSGNVGGIIRLKNITLLGNAIVRNLMPAGGSGGGSDAHGSI